MNRRSYLKATLGATAGFGLAGCTGNGGGDGTTNLVASASNEASTATAALNGLATEINQLSDSINLEVRTSPGPNANVGALQSEEIDIGYITHWTWGKLMNQEEPFGDTDPDFINQAWHHYRVNFLFFTEEGSGLDTLGDIEGTAGALIDPASGTGEWKAYALNNITENYERVSGNPGEAHGAIQEGTADWGWTPIMNADIEASYTQEAKQVLDAKALPWPDDVKEDIANDPLTTLEEVDLAQFGGWGYDTMDILTNPYSFVVRSDMDEGVLNELMTLMYENREELGDRHAHLEYYANEDHYLQFPLEGCPYHPGAADLYQSEGVWQDDLEIGN